MILLKVVLKKLLYGGSGVSLIILRLPYFRTGKGYNTGSIVNTIQEKFSDLNNTKGINSPGNVSLTDRIKVMNLYAYTTRWMRS
jgi:hypothetical protein